jgi:hypothetical protein
MSLRLGVPYLKFAGEDGRLAVGFMLLFATLLLGFLFREKLEFAAWPGHIRWYEW